MSQFDNVSVVKQANVYFDGKCVSHTVQFTDGRTLVARAVRYDSFGAYYTSSSYLIDSAALALAGQNIRTVATVVSSTPSGHGLNWQALGFTPRS